MQPLRQWSVRHATDRAVAFAPTAGVPGVYIPESVLQRIAGADNQKAEAKTLLVETIRSVSEIEGVAGVHLMGYRNDDMLAEAIDESGIRRGVSTRAA